MRGSWIASNWKALISVTVIVLVVMSVVYLVFTQPSATPVFRREYITVGGIIEDMWLSEDRCFFSIKVGWSNNSEFIGEDIICMVLFLDEESGHYVMIPSSQGWQIGDSLNSTVEHNWDERSESYYWNWVRVPPKGVLNYAREPQHGIDVSLLVAAASIVLLAVIVTIGILNARKRKGV